MKLDHAKRSDGLERENQRRRKALPDLTLVKVVLLELSRGKFYAHRTVATVSTT